MWVVEMRNTIFYLKTHKVLPSEGSAWWPVAQRSLLFQFTLGWVPRSVDQCIALKFSFIMFKEGDRNLFLQPIQTCRVSQTSCSLHTRSYSKHEDETWLATVGSITHRLVRGPPVLYEIYKTIVSLLNCILNELPFSEDGASSYIHILLLVLHDSRRLKSRLRTQQSQRYVCGVLQFFPVNAGTKELKTWHDA